MRVKLLAFKAPNPIVPNLKEIYRVGRESPKPDDTYPAVWSPRNNKLIWNDELCV